MYRQLEKLVKQQYLLHMSWWYGALRPTNGWDPLASLGHPCKFQWVSRIGSVTARHSTSGRQPNLRRWTEGATYIRQGGHHVGYWPTFLVLYSGLWHNWLTIYTIQYIFHIKPEFSAHSYAKYTVGMELCIGTINICLKIKQAHQ